MYSTGYIDRLPPSPSFKTSLEINEKFPAFDDDDSSSSIFSFKKKRPPYLPSDAISRGQYVSQPRPPKGNVVTQRHYGITIHTRFNEKIHREEEKCWNSFEERWDAGNQIKWLIQKVCLYLPLSLLVWLCILYELYYTILYYTTRYAPTCRHTAMLIAPAERLSRDRFDDHIPTVPKLA